MTKKDVNKFVTEAINSAHFSEIPEFLWLWDEFVSLIIKEKVTTQNFEEFWECIRNRELDEEHYGLLLDKGITFEMMKVIEMNERLFSAAFKRKWLHKEMLRHIHMLTHDQIVMLFVEGEFHDSTSLNALYSHIIERDLNPKQLVKVMCRCNNAKSMVELVDSVPYQYWRDDVFLELIAKGSPIYSDDDYHEILGKVIFYARELDLAKIVDLFGYQAFYKYFEEDEYAEYHIVELYIQTLNPLRDMKGEQWFLLLNICDGDAEKAAKKLKRCGYSPTVEQLEELFKLGDKTSF